MYDIVEVTINGRKVNLNDIVVTWREPGGRERSGNIESYANKIAQVSVGLATSGCKW